MTETIDLKKALRLGLLATVSLCLVACASTDRNGTFSGEDTEDVEMVIATPVQDLGLDDIDVPQYLASMENPYTPVLTSCDEIKLEVARLNTLLGSDLDVTEDEDMRRTQLALNASSDAVGSILIPFRGVVRAVTGAAANERDARTAYQRGLVRRAYLKGKAESMDCVL